MEREAALLAHLNLYGSYYRAMLWNSMPPMEQLEFLRTLLPLSIVEPHAVGFIGDQLAFPVKLDLSPEARAFIDQLITQNAAVSALARTEPVTLPTPSVTVESRLGMCDGCEEFVQKQRDLELTSKDLQNQLLEQEVARYTARLGGTSPKLDDPKPASSPLHIVVEQSPANP